MAFPECNNQPPLLKAELVLIQNILSNNHWCQLLLKTRNKIILDAMCCPIF